MSSSSIEQVHPPQQPPLSFFPEPNSSSTLPPSPISLEFLSCLQTNENIPIHKINDVIIPALRQNLAKWDDQHSPQQATYEKARQDLFKIQRKLDRLKEWEKRLSTLTKDLMLSVWESVEISQVAIPDIDEMVSELRFHVSLPFKTSLAAKSSKPVQSSDSSDLSIPDNAISILKWSRDFPETEAFFNFRARYDRLGFPERQSLLYFSFFPENSLIRKKVLTYLWIGEGVIQSTVTEDSEEIADRLLKDLVREGFIEPVEEKDVGDFNVCSVKPYVQPALLTIAHNRGFFDFDSDGNATVNSRRACLVKTEEGSVQHLSTYKNPDKLLTLFNVNENCIEFPSPWLSKTENISVIHLGNWHSSSTHNYIEAENPNFLQSLQDAKLKHLRCLSLNGISGITKLPDFITTFDELNILDLNSCLGLAKLPSKIHLLRKLTRLDMSGCNLLDEMPKGLASLSELRVLKGFVIHGSRKGRIKLCTLSDLVRLEKLRKLSLYADKETTGQNGELNCLSRFTALKILTISWTASVPSNMRLNLPSVASSSLPAGLEKLDLRGWPSAMMPNWIKPRELNSLKKLYIRGGNLSGMQIMHPGQSDSPQWTVKILRLKFLKKLRMYWNDVRTLFPSLVYLEKVDCPELSSFPFEGVMKFPAESTSR